MLILINWLC